MRAVSAATRQGATTGPPMSVATIATVPRVRPVVELGVGNSYDPQGVAQWEVARWGDAGGDMVGP